MNKDDLVRDLAGRFQPKKDAFLSEVESSIVSFISGQGKNCLTLIEKTGYGNKRWELAASPGYCGRLIALCRGKRYDGHELDSALTEPTVEIVTQKFQRLYESSENDIGEAVLQLVLRDTQVAGRLVGTILVAAVPAASVVREQLLQLVVHQIHQFLQSSSGHAVTSTIGKTVGSSAAGPIAAKIASMILASFSTKVKLYVGKLLMTTTIKGTVAVAVKKFLIYAVGAAIVKAIAVKFGIAVTASTIMWVLIPVIAIYILYEVSTFPEHLAKSVSSKVVADLSTRFRDVNTEVLDAVVMQLLNSGTEVIARSIAEDIELQAATRELLKELDRAA